MKNNYINKKKKKVPTDSTIDPDIIFTWRQIPLDERIVQKYAEDLRKYPDTHPECKSITSFMEEKEIYRDQYYKLVDKYPYFKQAHEWCKQKLGERLWSNAVDRKTDWKATHWRLHTYSQEFDEINQYHAKLSQEKESAIAQAMAGILHSNKDQLHPGNKKSMEEENIHDPNK